MRVLVFDTETTGLPEARNTSIYETSKWPHIVQLGYLIYDTEEKEVCVDIDTYINIPDSVTISEESAKIHHITRQMCNHSGMQIQEALLKFKFLMNTCDCVIAHNLSFDKRMLIVEGIRNNIRMDFKTAEYCTMKKSTDICKIEKLNKTGQTYYKYPTLSELHKHLFNKEPKNTHNAFADILICLKCYCKILFDDDIEEISNHTKQLCNKYFHD